MQIPEIVTLYIFVNSHVTKGLKNCNNGSLKVIPELFR